MFVMLANDISLYVNVDNDADEKIIPITSWKPDLDCKMNGFAYDTMSSLKELLDALEDEEHNGNDSNSNNQIGTGGIKTGDTSNVILYLLGLLVGCTD